MTAVERAHDPLAAVVVVGPGRVGTVVAAALARAGHEVVAATGGGDAARTRFQQRFPAARVDRPPADAVRAGDLIVFATPDDVLADVVASVAAGDGFHARQRIVHVAGSFGIAPLAPAQARGARVAACHPAQTIPTADAPPHVLDGAAWAVTAGVDDRAWARELVQQLRGVAHDVSEEQRPLYHAGLVIGSNAVGAAAAVARELLLAAGVGDPRAFLDPLVRASVAHVLERGADALTGPVVRGDGGTIRGHLTRLDAVAPALGDDYRHLSAVVLAQVRQRLTAAVAAELDEVLRPRDGAT